MVTAIAAAFCLSAITNSALAALPFEQSTLPEASQSAVVAPGVQYQLITRGTPGGPTHWLISMGLARTPEEARQAAACLAVLQLKPQPQSFVFPGSKPISYQDVVAGDFPAREAAAQVLASHHLARTCQPEVKAWALYPTDTREPMLIHVLTVDPTVFKGELVSARADDSFAGRHLVTEISHNRGAIAGVNGGYFVMKASDGVVGESAGIAAVNGRLTSGPTAGRPWVELDNRAGIKLTFHSGLPNELPAIRWSTGAPTILDGLNRQPDMLRNCGALAAGAARQPWHDRTCHVSNQLVAITSEAGFKPAAPQTAAVFMMDAGGAVRKATTSSTIGAGETLLIATGTRAAELELRVKRDPHATLSAETRNGGVGVFALNGGPLLVQDGRLTRTEGDEGWPFSLANQEQALAMHLFVSLRNARTAIGETKDGKILIVVVDGFRYRNERPSPLPMNGGATLDELRQIMVDLGATNAMNLDGGGSSVMVTNQKIVTHPSDDAGEREIGDAVLLIPNKRP